MFFHENTMTTQQNCSIRSIGLPVITQTTLSLGPAGVGGGCPGVLPRPELKGHVAATWSSWRVYGQNADVLYILA